MRIALVVALLVAGPGLLAAAATGDRPGSAEGPGIRSDGHPTDHRFSTSLSFGSATFDPLDPIGLRYLDGLAAEGRNDRSEETIPFVVQFHLPVPAGTTERLVASGVTVVPHYVREGGFIVLAAPSSTSTLSALPGARWVGEYLPALKFEYAQDIPAAGLTRVVVSTFAWEGSISKLVAIAQANRARVLQIDDHPFWGGYAIIEADASLVRSFARLPYVDTIEPYVPAAPIPIIIEKSPSGADLLNGQASWVIQSFQQGSTPVWDKGLHGEGIIVGCGDTGIDYDHLVFRDAQSSAGTPGPSHRKVIKLTQYANTVEESSLPHGSHVVGSILGKSINDPQGYVMNDGQAYHAKIAFMDIYDQSKGWDEIIPPMRDYFQDAYDAGARIHSNSWGGRSNTSDGDYSWRSEGADQYMWDHPDFLAVYAAGNSGPNAGTVNEPGTGKNLLTIGSAQNGNTKALSSFSSNGPSKDGVRKPDVITPGGGVTSAKGDETIGNMNTGYESWSGTSMATPTAAGGLALVQQYMNEGWHPGGTKGSGPAVTPSGPLLKALAINSAWNQFPASNVDANIPDNSQGWGKVRLDDVLFFTGDTRNLWFDDAAFAGGLQTGDRVAYTVNATAGEPLKITLVWNDFPGHGLINDIDLVVTDPNGTKFLGSVFANGVSTAGGTADNKNANEQVLFATPAPGSWTVEVVGKNVPRGPQPYALAATGAITGASKGGSSAPSVLSTSPANKASGVPIATNISIVFDRAMDKASVEAAISSTPPVAGAFAWSAGDTVVKLTPTASLTNGTLYQLIVAQSAKDATGKPMTRDFAFEFTTATGLKLSVVRTDPSDGQTYVLEDTTVRVLFSQDVVKSSAETGFDLAPLTSGAFSWPLPTTLVFKPAASLLESTQYTIKVSKDVQDTQGTKLGTDFTATFTTRPLPDSTPPAVAILEPAAAATLTGDAKIKVSATDARGIFEVESFIDGNSLGRISTAPYEWDWATTSWPNGPRKISAVARDTSGNQATDAIQVTVENDVDPPKVVGVSPADGAKGVGTLASITLTFSEPVETGGAQSAFSLSPAAQGTFAWSGNAMKFTPSAPLGAGTRYTFTVKAGVKDLAGNAMTKDFVSTFETAAGGSLPGPAGLGGLLYLLIIIAIIGIGASATLLIVRKRRRPAALQGGPMQGVPQFLPCPSCGATTPVGGVTCAQCGAELSAPPPGWGPRQ